MTYVDLKTFTYPDLLIGSRSEQSQAHCFYLPSTKADHLWLDLYEVNLTIYCRVVVHFLQNVECFRLIEYRATSVTSFPIVESSELRESRKKAATATVVSLRVFDC